MQQRSVTQRHSANSAQKHSVLLLAISIALGSAFVSGCADDGTTEPEPGASDDGGPGPASEPDPFADYGEVIDAPAAEWSWVDFPDTHCGNGTETGIGINPGTSGRVLFYLEGGGACWDGFTCNQGQLATNVASGVNSAFASQYFNSLGGNGIWDRNNDDNPFRDDSFVWVPYCTGDLHAGSVASNSYNVQHVGADNIAAILNRVVPTFGDSSSVVLTGTSAGGFGAILNFDRVQEQFKHIPVHLLADSAPPMGNDFIKQSFQDVQRAAWNLDANTPEGCTTCGDLYGTFRFVAEKHSDRNIGLVSSLADQTLLFFFGLGYSPIGSMTPANYSDGLSELLGRVSDLDNVRTYYVNGNKHVYIYDQPLGTTSVAGTGLTEWMRGFLGEAQVWPHVAP